MKVEKVPENVEEYIANFPSNIQDLLTQIRVAIKAAAPNAQEMISYRMPAYKHQGMLLYFAAHKSHIGLYPYPSAMATFAKEIVKYKGKEAKGSLHFQFDEPLPLALISSIVKFRVAENEEKAALKKQKTKGN